MAADIFWAGGSYKSKPLKLVCSFHSTTVFEYHSLKARRRLISGHQFPTHSSTVTQLSQTDRKYILLTWRIGKKFPCESITMYLVLEIITDTKQAEHYWVSLIKHYKITVSNLRMSKALFHSWHLYWNYVNICSRFKAFLLALSNIQF